jgi:LytR cell envelope-related transcriptional attenuator
MVAVRELSAPAGGGVAALRRLGQAGARSAGPNFTAAVEYSLPTLEPVAQRWRIATFITAGVAGLELVVIVIVLAALIGKSSSIRTHTAPPAPLTKSQRARLTSAPAGRTRLARGATTVVVLNGNGRTGAAASMAALVRARGYRTGTVGNAPRDDYPHTVVMYRGRFRAEALRLARDMHVRIVGPLDGLKRSVLGRAQVAVVVGR